MIKNDEQAAALWYATKRRTTMNTSKGSPVLPKSISFLGNNFQTKNFQNVAQFQKISKQKKESKVVWNYSRNPSVLAKESFFRIATNSLWSNTVDIENLPGNYVLISARRWKENSSGFSRMSNNNVLGAVHILCQPLEGGGGGKPKDDNCWQKGVGPDICQIMEFKGAKYMGKEDNLTTYVKPNIKVFILVQIKWKSLVLSC